MKAKTKISLLLSVEICWRTFHTKRIFEALLFMMKKHILFFLLLAFPFLMNGQTRNITIDWNARADQSINTKDGSKQTSNHSERVINGLKLQITDDTILFQDQWKDNVYADEKSLVVTNIVYGSLSEQELKDINKSIVPKKISYSINSAMGRDILYTIFSITPVIYENGSYKKVISCTVTYNQKSVGRNQGSRMQIINSVLASGNWYKFKVDKTGIYRLDKNFLNDIGMNTDGINPRNLKVYGHGGQPLPLLNALNNQFDIPETAIKVVGEEDNSFDNGDFIIFYGTSTKGYVPNNDSNINPYSDDSYYYVTADGGQGLRVQPMQEPSGAPTTTITTFNDYQFHELDEVSPAKLGRRWFGNRFDINSEQSFEFNFPNIVSGQDMAVKVKAGAVSESTTSMALSINGAVINPIIFIGLPSNVYLVTNKFEGNIPASGETITLDLAYNNNGNPSSNAFLDYISIDALRQLKGVDGKQLPFQYNQASNTSGIGEYQISNASQFNQVWDVTNPSFIVSKQNEPTNGSLTFKATLGELRKYVAINPSDFYSPIKIAQSTVFNQNLKGTIFNDESGNFKDIDYIIVTAPFMLQPALRLASFHKNLNGLNVKVVTTDRIYEEFSSGKQDISAIRNFMRYVYENASSPDKRVKYLCLFGDTSLDYKKRIPGNNLVVPTFHTVESTSGTTSFMSDDFFGNMDTNEGTIGFGRDDGIPNGPDIDKLDIAVGRIVADNVGLANAMVDKIVNYASKDSYGNWRTNFVLISDDNDGGEQTLEVSLDQLGDIISAEKPFINVKKIHSDAYQQESSAGGNRYPEVNAAIKNAIEVGAIIMNYFGHGGEDGLAKEFIYTKGLAQELRNKNNLPCIITVTCEFTKFDDPQRITAGELTFQNREGGAISLVTTTRSITISLGIQFNNQLADQLFGFGREVPNPPAEGLRVSKNNINNELRRVVFYVGDPALELAFPKKEVILTTLNGLPLGQATDTLKALSRVRMGGEVRNSAGNLMSDYNGVVEVKVYDKNVQRQTLDNDNQGFILNFITLGEGLFNGQATATNGLFEFEFVVPRDIQIPVGNGRVSLYSQRNNVLEDQTGYNNDVKVGGLNENAPEDNEGPLIRLFMNDESFVSGGITNDSPNLIAKLEDPNGINTASGIGHDIVAVLDGDETNPFILNEFYQANVDDFTKGDTHYKFRNLEDGLHTLTVKAWDVYNNSSTQEIQFVVAGNDQLVIERVLNYPNPFVNYTEFWFSHNRPLEPLDIQVQVFTVTGKVVWTKNVTDMSDGNLYRNITWDGKDDFGDKIGKGVYVYKITVRSTLTNHRVEKYEKLVIL